MHEIVMLQIETLVLFPSFTVSRLNTSYAYPAS
jgi:hypothetical protein